MKIIGRLPLLLSLLLSSAAHAATCVANLIELVQDSADPAAIRQLITAHPERMSVRTRNILALLDRLPDTSAVKRVLSTNETFRILADEENLFYSGQIETLLTNLSAVSPERLSNDAEAPAILREELRKILANKVPNNQVEARIDDVMRVQDANTIRRALGQLSLEEMKLHMHGANALAPSADSLLGKFIAETGSATLVRRFKKQPGGSELGPERLVVAIGPENFEAFKKVFADRMDLMMHYHTPQQGTLLVQHNGSLHKYTRMGYTNAFRMDDYENSILPTILMSTSESQRVRQFFELGATDPSLVKHPWARQGYCATGGYASCTHWMANIPMGDTLVDRYAFPGYLDNYASNHLLRNNAPVSPADDAAPRVQTLGDYADDPSLNPSQQAAVRRVWKARRGNEQLASVLGVLENSVNGEMASPGFTAMTLTGSASAERVPVVFVRVRNHRTAIDPNFDPQMNAY